MSSGFGTKGTVGRCYPLWSSFESCLGAAEKKEMCIDLRDDYLECLHHKKEFKRVRDVMAKDEEAKNPTGNGGADGHGH